MTQSLLSHNLPAMGAPSATPETPLMRLLRGEFSERRLTQILDLDGERVPDRVWTSALSGPLFELLGRPGKEFRSRLVEVAYDVSRRAGLWHRHLLYRLGRA